MYSISQQGNTATAYKKQYLADELADITTLPTDCAPGSTCMVIEDATLWILNNKRQWVPFGSGGSGGGAGSGINATWSPF